MSDPKEPAVNAPSTPSEGGTAVKTKPVPAKRPPQILPPWKVLLHNDDVNDYMFVVETIVMLTPLNEQDAVERMKEAHETGTSLIMTTHRERAELVQQQFASRGLTVTIEPA
jgi:ATP-dependent Clp protease adaptor protein ClpS